jgi:dTDP-6-deoxy-L-talose 4-dehydrogenase (NAD+)
MKILLTGATGFIGSAFLRLSLERGHDVAALVRRHRDGLISHPRLTWIDGSLELADWKSIEDWQPECVLHSAWIAEPVVYLDSPLNPKYAADSLGFIRRAVRAGVKHCVALGTCIEYLPSGEPLREDVSPLDPNPQHPYVRAKLELHRELESASREEAWLLAWTRIFYPYGSGEHPDRLCSQLAQRLIDGQEVVLKTPASVKDYICIDDVAAALLVLCETRAGGSFNIGTGSGHAIRDVAAILGKLTGREELIREAPDGQDPFPHVVADATKLNALGWRQRISLEAGLKRLVDSISQAADS